MQKINFENKPSTNSPINATNLNALQDNVEDAIDEVTTQDSGWQPLSLINNWTSLGTSWLTPSYRKINNQVFIRAIIGGGTLNSICATLPEGYRPAGTQYLVSATSVNTGGVIRITTDGNIRVQNDADWIDIEVSFLID